jgi:hypothetical protein
MKGGLQPPFKLHKRRETKIKNKRKGKRHHQSRNFLGGEGTITTDHGLFQTEGFQIYFRYLQIYLEIS